MQDIENLLGRTHSRLTMAASTEGDGSSGGGGGGGEGGGEGGEGGGGEEEEEEEETSTGSETDMDEGESDEAEGGGGAEGETRSERGASWAGEYGLRTSQAEKDGLLPAQPPVTPDADGAALLVPLPPTPSIAPGRSFEIGVAPPQHSSLLTPDLTPPKLETRLSDSPASDRDIIRRSEKSRTKL